MNSTILLTKSNFPPQVSKALFTLIGVGQLFFAYHNLGRVALENGEPLPLFEGSFYLVCGVCFIAYAGVSFSNTPITPKIEIDDREIRLKWSVFSQIRSWKWEEIKSINLGSFQIEFELADSKERISYKYQASSKISIQVKKMIRAAGEQRGISVTGG